MKKFNEMSDLDKNQDITPSRVNPHPVTLSHITICTSPYRQSTILVQMLNIQVYTVFDKERIAVVAHFVHLTRWHLTTCSSD